jgi:hypothetical protein
MPDLPAETTPLYNHPLPALEAWLQQLGAIRRPSAPCLWDLHRPCWSASIELELEDLKVSWEADGQECTRQFPYGLSRADVEAAILAGP